MAYQEIDSFVKKFKILCQGGRNASLTLSSKAGKVRINLSVDLGVLSRQDPQPQHPQNQHPRNGPAQQRRRERRAAARQAAAEEAEAILTLEEKEVLDLAENAKANQDAEQVEDTTDDAGEVTIIEVVQTSVEEITDEVVTDSEYESMAVSKDDPQTESSPIEEPPPPVRDRSLGGIDYYTLSYDDLIFKKRHY